MTATRKQRFIRRGVESNATARRLIERSQNIAQYVLQTTVELDEGMCLLHKRARITAVLAGQRILAGQDFYFVESGKFAGRYYIVVRTVRGWECSSADERIRAYCVRQVESYREAVQVAA